jgi:hypothetical protein
MRWLLAVNAAGRPGQESEIMHGHEMSIFEQFVDILTKPDNIPIVGMLFLVLFFTWLALKQGLRNDQLIEQGRIDEILDEAHK